MCLDKEELILLEEPVLPENPTPHQKKMWDLTATTAIKSEDLLKQNLRLLYDSSAESEQYTDEQDDMGQYEQGPSDDRVKIEDNQDEYKKNKAIMIKRLKLMMMTRKKTLTGNLMMRTMRKWSFMLCSM